MKNKGIISIAVIPDRMAHYRLAVFRALAHLDRSKYKISFCGEEKKIRAGIKLIKSEDFIYDDGQVIDWQQTTDFYWKNRCIWQSGVLCMAVGRHYKVLILWGESHRISSWIAAILARLNGKKVIFWTHGLYGNESFLKKWFRIMFYRLGNAVLLYGSYAKKRLDSHIDKSKLHVINNSLDVNKQNRIYKNISSQDRAFLKKKLINSSDKLIGFVGRLRSEKRLELLLEAIAILKTKGEYCYLIIVGDGEHRAVLSALSKSLDLEDQVVFYGECYVDETLIPLLSVCDVVISPGNVGLTAMHALISGTPVITHSNACKQGPEFEAVMDGVSGFLFEYGSVENLVEKIILCFHYLEQGRINDESCRSVIFEKYSPDFQLKVLGKALCSV